LTLENWVLSKRAIGLNSLLRRPRAASDFCKEITLPVGWSQLKIRSYDWETLMADGMNNIKAAANEIVSSLPDEANWDDLMHRIYVRKKIDAGLRDVANGATLSHSEVLKRYGVAE
jgi:hypothetical protein